MECFLSSSSTGSSNHPCLLKVKRLVLFRTNPPKRPRKHDIATLFADVTNQSESCPVGLCKEDTISKVYVYTAMAQECGYPEKIGKSI